MTDLIDPSDLRVEVDEHPPGPKVGVLTGVRVTHIPTGISAHVDGKRSQWHNRQVAIEMIEAALTSPNFRFR